LALSSLKIREGKVAEKVYQDFNQVSAAAKSLARNTGCPVKITRRGENYMLVSDDPRQKEQAKSVKQEAAGSMLKAIKYDLVEADWEEATKRASQLPIYEYSHREHDANVVGTLGEVVAEKWFRDNGILVDDERQVTTHDYRLANGRTIDVKTKDRTVKPQPHYDCSVPMYNHEHQRPDYYVFVSLQRSRNSDSSARSFKHAYLLGMSDQALLEKVGTVWEEGQVDPDNGTQFWTACINVRVADLVSPGEAVKILRASSDA
jgi:hypothetical protein